MAVKRIWSRHKNKQIPSSVDWTDERSVVVFNKLKKHMLVTKERTENTISILTSRFTDLDSLGNTSNEKGVYVAKWNPKDKENYTEMSYVQFVDLYGMMNGCA